ncbi:hypothetical protein ACLOJK_009011 [Asimina triloba]
MAAVRHCSGEHPILLRRASDRMIGAGQNLGDELAIVDDSIDSVRAATTTSPLSSANPPPAMPPTADWSRLKDPATPATAAPFSLVFGHGSGSDPISTGEQQRWRQCLSPSDSTGGATMAAVDSVSIAFDFQIRRPRRRIRLLHQCRQQITATHLETNRQPIPFQIRLLPTTAELIPAASSPTMNAFSQQPRKIKPADGAKQQISFPVKITHTQTPNWQRLVVPIEDEQMHSNRELMLSNKAHSAISSEEEGESEEGSVGRGALLPSRPVLCERCTPSDRAGSVSTVDFFNHSFVWNDVKSCTACARAEPLCNDVLSGQRRSWLAFAISITRKPRDCQFLSSSLDDPISSHRISLAKCVRLGCDLDHRTVYDIGRFTGPVADSDGSPKKSYCGPPRRRPASPSTVQATIILDVIPDDRRSLDQLPDDRTPASPTSDVPDGLCLRPPVDITFFLQLLVLFAISLIE